MRYYLKKFILCAALSFIFFPTKRAWAQTAGDYRSQASGNWNTASTWERYDGSTWIASPAQGAPTNSMGAITIQNSHTVTITEDVTLDQVIIDPEGQVILNNGVALTIANGSGTDLLVSGTFMSAGTVATKGTITFSNGGKYLHNFSTSAGSIPTATWSTGSSCEIIGYTTVTAIPNIGLAQRFYNFTWNCPLQSKTLSMLGGLTTVLGNFSIVSTGTGVLQLANSLVANRTLTVSGNYTQTGGTLTLLGSNSSYYQYLNIAGNFSMSGGTLQKGNGNGRIFFTGTTERSYTKTGGSFSGAIPFTINNGAIMNFGTSVLDGSSGAFTLASGATIITSHPKGLGTNGTIQTTGSKSFSSGANYQFRGASTGAFTTSTANTVNNLTISSSGTSLDQNLTVNGTLTLISGNLSLGNYNLTIGTSASIKGYQAFAYIKTDGTGLLKRSISSSATIFPVGNTSYNPITFTNTGTADSYGIRVIDGIIPANIANADQTVNRRWVITENIANGSNLSVMAQYNDGEAGDDFNSATYNFIGFYNGTSWQQNAATKTGNNPYTFNSSANFNTLGDLRTGTKYFAIGRNNGFITPTKLVITSVSPAVPVAGTPFSVTVQAQDANDQPAMVGANTTFNLSSIGSAGALSGTTSGTMSPGTNTLTLNGAKYNSFGTATLTAIRTSGISLAQGSSSTFNVLAAEPEIQASAITFSEVDGDGMTINWSAAPGTGSIVLLRSGGSVNSIPVDGTWYQADPVFRQGTQIGTGNYVVYNGTGSSVTITGLAAGTTYYVAICSFYGSSSFTNYLTPDPATESQRSLARGDFRSKISGEWSSASNWETWNGNQWTSTSSSPNNSNGVITICKAHTVTITSSLTADQLVVETGGTLVVNNGKTLSVANITSVAVDAEINGTLDVAGTLSAAGSTIWINGGLLRYSGKSDLPTGCIFDRGATYEHAKNGGTLPNATWREGSTCLITGITDAATLAGVNGKTFFNFTWNCPAQTSTLNMGASTMGVSGDFKLVSSGSGSLLLQTSSATLDVSGDYIQTGGTFAVVSGDNNTGSINLGGDYFQTGGTLTTGSGSNQATKIFFKKAGKQTFKVSDNIIGPWVDFIVNKGSTISLGTSILTGRSFTLSSGAGLETAHPQGLSYSGSTGSIQTTTRSLNAGADYTYNGNIAQITGDGLPSTLSDLTIDNPTGLTLSSDCTVNGTIFLNNGLFNINTTTLTVNASISRTEGSLGSAAAGTVIYNKQSNGQVIICGSYGNLSLSNYNKTFESAGNPPEGTSQTANILIAGTLNTGTASGHNTGESIISFNGNTDQEIPASLEYFSLCLTGAGTKHIKASSPVELRVKGNFEVNAPVSFTNISLITVVNNVSGNQALNTGPIPVTIGGDWKNTATGTTVTGLYTYNGESATIQDVGALNYKDLKITASRGESFPVTANLARGPVSIAHSLHVGPGCELASNGNLTLLASENANANVAPLLGDAKITGDVNVQSFIRGGSSTSRGTRAMSSPVISSNIYEQLKAFMLVTGPTGEQGRFDAGGKGQPYAVTITNYNESAQASQSAFKPIETLDEEANPPGMGFIVFFRGNRSNPVTKLNAPFAVPESVMVSYKGPLNQGDIEVSVPNSNNPGDPYNGYLLAGNPYPSTIDLAAVLQASTGIKPNITIIRAGTAPATYSIELGADGAINGGSNFIQPGQAFYVSSVSNGGILRFNEEVKNIEDSTVPLRFLSTPPNETLKMFQGGSSAVPVSSVTKTTSNSVRILRFSLTDNTNKEEALIAFREDFSEEADDYDAPYFSGTSINLSSLSSDSVQLAINTFPLPSKAKEIPLSVNANVSGTLKLKFDRVPEIATYQLSLKDKMLNKIIPVVPETEYVFQLDKDIRNTYGSSRFSLLINPATILAVHLKSFTAKKISAGTALNWTTAQEKDSRSFEIERSTDGQTFIVIGSVAATGNSSVTRTYSYIDPSPVQGNNYYRLRETSFKKETHYSDIININWQIRASSSLTICPNPAEKFLEIKTFEEQVRWKFKVFDLLGRELMSTEKKLLNIEDLSSGTYLIVVIDQANGNVVTTEKFIKK